MNNSTKIAGILLVFLFFLLDYQNSFGKEPPTLNGVVIESTVAFNGSTNIYTYTYTLFNPQTNTGTLQRIEIDVRKPSGGANLGWDGLVSGPGYLKNSSEDILSRTTTPAIVPVGFQTPNGWLSGYTINGTAKWGAGDEVLQLKPGTSQGGFVLTSYGLPSIRDFKAIPWLDETADYYPTPESVEGAEDLSAAIRTKILQLIDQVSFKGKTIGPTAPPADFKPEDFLNCIIDLKHQAFSLGWMTNQGVENSLDSKLDNAKKKIEAGDNKTAKNILNAFVNEVEAQNGKHLTLEAYALLKYNVQYLIEKLQ